MIHAATIFLSSFLLFLVQPLIARLILPWFGGSAAVVPIAFAVASTALAGVVLWALRRWSGSLAATRSLFVFPGARYSLGGRYQVMGVEDGPAQWRRAIAEALGRPLR